MREGEGVGVGDDCVLGISSIIERIIVRKQNVTSIDNKSIYIIHK